MEVLVLEVRSSETFDAQLKTDRELNGQNTISDNQIAPEIRISARVVSRGTAIGNAICLHGRKRQFFRIEIPAEKREAELARLNSAIETATKQLETLISNQNLESTSDILDVQLLFVQESSLVEKFKNTLFSESVNAEWAVKLVSEEYLDRYRALKDEHLKEKAIDLEDVCERILNALAGNDSVQFLDKEAIIVASEIRPSTMLEFLNVRPAAIVTEHGGWTSHAFIMARELGIPAISGVKDALRIIKTGDVLSVDAVGGELIIRPNASNRNLPQIKQHDSTKPISLTDRSIGTARTLDNVEIRISANVDKPEGCRLANEMGAKGVGLLRSEYLFEKLSGFPDEEAQTSAYREVVLAAGKSGIRIRTFDLGIEQVSLRADFREKNPALGLRAIRLSLAKVDQFRIQIRSILKASVDTNVSIVLPLVSGVDQIQSAVEIINNEKSTLANNGVQFGEPKLGAMIELPSAVFSINEILRYTDFVCLGTNDLVQYLLGVDRDNGSIADWYQTLHPAVIRSIQTVLDAARASDKPALICGEMAGSPFYTPILIGLGATDLSMNLSSMAAVHKLITGIGHSEAYQLVNSISSLETASEIEAFLIDYYLKNWSDLFSPDLLKINPDKQN